MSDHQQQQKASAADVIATLKSIDSHLAALVQHFGCGPRATSAPTSSPVPEIAPDSDLDGKYGNPAIRAKDPRDWSGESQLGKPMSECPPEYLDLVASRLDYFAGNETDEKKARYNRLDASRARGWAKRLRAGWKPAEAETGDQVTSDDIAF